MKKFVFVVALVSGLTFETSGMGYNASEALMDACDQLAKSGEYPEDDIDDVELLIEEDVKC